MKDGPIDVGGQTEWFEIWAGLMVGVATAPVAEAGNDPLNYRRISFGTRH